MMVLYTGRLPYHVIKASATTVVTLFLLLCCFDDQDTQQIVFVSFITHADDSLAASVILAVCLSTR